MTAAGKLRQHRTTLGFLPSDLSGLAMWFEAGALGQADSTAVATWPDRSGNGRDATQATGSKQPTYRINLLGGRPVVSFDGNSDALSTASFTGMATTTILIAAKFNNIITGTPDLCDGVGGRQLVGIRSSKFVCYQGTALSDGPATDLNAHVFTALMAGNATSRIGVDGTLATAANLGTNSLTQLMIGARGADAAAEFFNGYLAEFIVYNSVLSAGNRQTVERYLGAKYGITVA